MCTRITLALLVWALTDLSSTGLQAAERAATRDQRARIVESGLKDMTAANEAAIGRQRVDPVRSADALGAPRVRLQPQPGPDSDTLVQGDVQSSLHRLHRETVSTRTEDDRRAIVEESLNRQAEQRQVSGSTGTAEP